MAEMEVEEEARTLQDLPESCVPGLNQVASYQMNISDAYLSMSFNYNKDTGVPLLAQFFDDQSDVKRFQARRVLRYIAKRRGRVCPPSTQRPEMDNLGNAVHALKIAMGMENELTKTLKDLNTLASEAKDLDLLVFIEDLLIKQKNNEKYLESQIAYEQRTKEQAQEEKATLERLLQYPPAHPAETPGSSAEANPPGAEGH